MMAFHIFISVGLGEEKTVANCSCNRLQTGVDRAFSQ